MSKVQRIKGVADLFRPEVDKFTFLENTAREVFGRYGYEEVRTPVMEKTELFARSIGEETDVVQKEMYTFPDRKGRSLTLRPEATAGVMRAYIENNRQAVKQVDRLFAFGPMFRYERPQKGRMRQFHQVDVELIGPSEPQSDAEILLMLWTYLRAIGLKKLSIELNSLGCEACRPAYRQALIDFFQAIDSGGLCDDCRRRKDTNPLRVLDCKVSICKELTANAPTIPGSLCSACSTHFDSLKRLLEGAGVDYTLNERLVRGLDYYVGATFEVSSSDIGAQTAVAGGGRYDGLIKQLGGPDVPGIGFALGMERLCMLLDDIQTLQPDFFLAAVDEAGMDAVLLLSQTLREAGLSGEVVFGSGSFKSRMRAANKSNVRHALLIGADEARDKTVLIKDMADGGQETVPLDQAVANLTGGGSVG